MAGQFEYIEHEGYDPRYHMPYVPAIKVHGGKTVYVSGVTAAPVYHSHPHVPSEFDHIPSDPAAQARMTMENLRLALRAAGGDLTDIVQMFRFIKDLAANQDAINRVIGQYLGDHRPTTTTVEVVRLATDPRLVLEVTAVAVVPD
ncbi:MAG TPA: RidA family protein [Chloroflexota bacterium]|jgi:enamine deaminase RidA (YjgF/YER057c/UK114 family)|nr:RidA family protein [Chloroflexota bacterium]